MFLLKHMCRTFSSYTFGKPHIFHCLRAMTESCCICKLELVGFVETAGSEPGEAIVALDMCGHKARLDCCKRLCRLRNSHANVECPQCWRIGSYAMRWRRSLNAPAPPPTTSLQNWAPRPSRIWMQAGLGARSTPKVSRPGRARKPPRHLRLHLHGMAWRTPTSITACPMPTQRLLLALNLTRLLPVISRKLPQARPSSGQCSPLTSSLVLGLRQTFAAQCTRPWKRCTQTRAPIANWQRGATSASLAWPPCPTPRPPKHCV